MRTSWPPRPHRRWRRPWLAASGALAIAAVLAAACSGGPRSPGSGSAPTMSSRSPTPAVASLVGTSRGYQIPRVLPPGGAGTVLAASTPRPDAALGAAQRWSMLYRSVWPAPDDAVSAMVLVPSGRAPTTGWPIVAWAHGTSGLADFCAPSLAPGLADDPTAVAEVQRFLRNGWAVVATDYPGLGTPGVHPYLVGRINGPAVVDAVVAARRLVPSLGKRWVLVGHSEGGQSALFAAQYATARAPGLDYVGAVALAPASLLQGLLPIAQAGHDATLSAYALYTLEGLAQVDPSVHPDQLVSPATARVLPDLTTKCDDDLMTDLGRVAPPRLLHASATTITRLAEEVGRVDDPDRARAPGPILLLQGTNDTDVPKGTTIVLAQNLCRLGDQVALRLYDGQDHGQLVGASWPTVSRWITDRFAGRAVPTTCPHRG